MRILTLAAVAALALATACSGGNAAQTAVAKNCVEGGGTEQVCNCVAEKLNTALTPQQMAVIAKGDTATEEEKQSMMNPTVLGALMNSAMQCGGAGTPTAPG